MKDEGFSKSFMKKLLATYSDKTFILHPSSFILSLDHPLSL
jgi:hypothetical protein